MRVKSISTKTNRKRTGSNKNVNAATRLFQALSTISPTSKKSVTSGLALDLTDLEAVGIRQKKLVKTLRNLRLPRDKKKFEWALTRIEGDLLFETQYHLSSIKKLLPILLADMSKSGRR